MTERFTPQMFIEYRSRQLGISLQEMGVAPVVVVSWSHQVIRSLADRCDARPPPHLINDTKPTLFAGTVKDLPVSFSHVPIGAPGTVTAMEEMIACGARLFVGLGWAGSLQPAAPLGSLLIPTSCVSEEGTSPHYIKDDERIRPDAKLVASLEAAAGNIGRRVFKGPQWTTDAPYRELIAKIEAYRKQGVLGVDMETSAMYALGQFRGVRVCNLLVVSDELWSEWNPAFGTEGLQAATKRAEAVIARLLEADNLLVR